MTFPFNSISYAVCRAAVISALAVISSPSLAQEAAASKQVTIGLIEEARPDVNPWAVAWHESVEAMKRKDPSLKVIETYDAFDPVRAEPVARQMIDAGVNVVGLTTFVLTDVAKNLSTDFPKVPMVAATFGVTRQPNLSSVTASYLEIGYANCWLLTKLSKDGRLGVVGAKKAPFETEQLEGCKLGATAANPSAQITLVNTNSFTDTQANREQVKSLLDQGIQNIFLISGTSDLVGGLRLCESSKAHCALIGGDRRWAPTATVTNVMLDFGVVLADLVDQQRTGIIKAKSFDLTFGNGGLKVPDFKGIDAVNPELEKGFQAMVADLASEKISLPDSKSHPGMR
ncbi:BMP family lipoprotein [Bradyrhizobium canariense]|uniref:Nucleoside-binding protein n=1 Tax=Bradyrhizobium canariense TaxID=255045 RepID=A0A1H1YRW6_9BRAD|nr:BMP family ABC transporter substrate-binding protein [Bradyrhizobium canariense]SDT23846.1 nucleoside-binding protein [Bradyrhizobium canariense]